LGEPREDDPWPDATSEKVVPSTAPTLPLGTRVFGVRFSVALDILHKDK